LFGWSVVRQALNNRQAVTLYALNQPNKVAIAAKQLGQALEVSEEEAINYCQQITPGLRDCLICCLVNDVAEAAIKNLGLHHISY
jgi:hypothetical protein